MDLGSRYCIRKISLKNSHNRGYRNVGTKSFTIQASNQENGGFQNLLTNEGLEDARNLQCDDIPVHEYDVCGCFRYLRLFINSYYGEYTGGLNYLSLE